MNKKISFALIGLFSLMVLAMIFNSDITGYFVLTTEEKQAPQNVRLGFCPTMRDDAIKISYERDYELYTFSSASEVFKAMEEGLIDKGLVGRIARSDEISKNTKKEIIKTGYTTIFQNREFLDVSYLPLFEIHTYFHENVLKESIPLDLKYVVYNSKEEALEKLEEGKIVLIHWDDWQDEFELLVVNEGGLKFKPLRGVFLYVHQN